MRKTSTLAGMSAAILFSFAGTAFSDTLTLRSGETVTGTYLGGSAREIRIDLGGRVRTYAIDQVSALQFDSAVPGPEASNQAPVNSPPPPPDDNAGFNNNPPPPSRAANRDRDHDNDRGSYNGGVTIPSGTAIVVRMIDAVDSDESRLGRTYRAAVDEAVVVNGQAVVPRGAEVVTKVVADEQSGKIQGRTVVALALQSIQINGQMVDVTSQDVRQESGSRAGKSGKVIGGTAALGAIIGALAGGGRGAAIGAVSGAAVGTGAQVLTHGERIRIPSESRLSFTLSNPLNL